MNSLTQSVIMIRDRETKVQERTVGQLELVAGGAMMDDLKLAFETLSNIVKTRSEISMSFARNARA